MEILTTFHRAAARVCATVPVIWCLAVLPPLATEAFGAVQTAAAEFAVKAAYLSKFALFIDWPDAAFDSPSSAINLCVAGMDPFGNALDKVVEGQHIGNRPISVRRIPVVTRNSGCHILYIGGSGEQSVAAGLEVANGSGALTVTDSSRPNSVAGMIDFQIMNARVRFNVDDQAASQNGLVISSHLLDLALSVKRRG